MEADLAHRPFQSFAQFLDRQNRYTSLRAEELLNGRPHLRGQIIWRLSMRPAKLFWKSHVKKQGFREGMYGLSFAVLFAWVEVLKWAKYWELSNHASRA